MKNKLALLALAGSAAFATSAQAQGLVGIGAMDEDFESGLPFTTTISADFGYDDNPTPGSGVDDETAYTRAGIDVRYIGGDRRTNATLGASFSTLYYFDGLDGADEDVFYNGRVSLDLRHQASRRLTVGNNAYVSYEIEPDYAIGESTSRRSDQYLYLYNSAWASYAWNRRFSTIGRYTVSGVKYDDSIVGDSEDRITQTASLEGRYLLTRLTTLVGEYRFQYTNYDGNDRDYLSNFLLVGFDHTFSRDLRGTVRVGAEIRDSDVSGTDTVPYAEFALRHAASRTSSFHWVTRIGYEDSELSDFEKRYSYRSSLSYQKQISQRLNANAGISYVHTSFEDSQFGNSDSDEDLVALSVGMSYRIFSNVDLNAGYHYTTITSDEDFREYERNRFTLGLSTTF